MALRNARQTVLSENGILSISYCDREPHATLTESPLGSHEASVVTRLGIEATGQLPEDGL